MPHDQPNSQLLRSLGQLTRGLSALFWGLPIALVTSVQAATGTWLGLPAPVSHLAPSLAFALLLYGLGLLGHFQKQERVWIVALDRARLLALTNLGLSPFLHWHQRLPDVVFYGTAVMLLAVSSVLFLLYLNQALRRLAAMLPDEMLRAETAAFTQANSWMLLAFPLLAATWHFALHASSLPLTIRLLLQWIEPIRPLFYLFLALLPLSVTLSLLWKLKEAILECVFSEATGDSDRRTPVALRIPPPRAPVDHPAEPRQPIEPTIPPAAH